MKRNIQFNLLIFLLFFGINFSFGQVTIATQDFDSTTPEWNYTANQGGYTTIQTVTSPSVSGNSIELKGTNKHNVDPNIVLDNIDISGYTSVKLWVSFAANGPDSSDDLYLDISYDNGTTWNGTGSIKLVDGYSGTSLSFGSTNASNPTTVGSNPYSVDIADSENQIKVRLRFNERINKNNTSDKYYIDNIKLEGIAAATNDTDTEILDTTQPNAATISSITNTDSNNPVSVFIMTIEDKASGDGLPTKVTNIRITPYTSNTVVWTNTIQGIVIDDGINFLTPTSVTITDTFIDITLANTELVVADGGTKDVTIAVYLNTSGLVDNKVLSFMVDGSNHGFTADASGSDFTSSLTNGSINSNNFTINVEATKLQFTQQPTNVEENSIMVPAVTVAYTDANGNVDVDYDGLGATATLSASGAAFAAGTTTDGTPVNGIMTFSDIKFTSPATGVALTVTDNAGITTPSITSNTFDVTAAPVGCSELFFSEYVEGSGNNKYLEIFNSTAATIDLANYDIAIYANGSNSPSIIISFTSGATMASNSVYVLAHSSATVWSGTPNQTVGNLNFNGNDVIALRKANTNIDVIGTIGSSAIFAENTTLVRKYAVSFPNTTYTTSEWNSLASNTVANLGMHASNCPCTATTIYSSGIWDNGVPNATTKAVFISNYNTSVANIDACKCQVDAGVTLTIAANSYLKVLDSITNNGSILVQNQGSVVQTNNHAAVTGVGTYNTEITTTNLVDENRFTYFSSPVVNATLNTFSPWADMLHLWDFTGSTQYWHNITNVNTVMTPARGYGIQPANGSTNVTPTTTFTGFFNNGIKTHAMYYNVANAPDPMDNSSVLVGNPYPSAINSNLLFQVNPQLGGIYIWNHDSALGNSTNSYGDWVNNDYIVCAANNNCTSAASGGPNATHSGFIASGQGFFATANVASPNDLVFNNSMRVTGNNTDFRRNANTTEKLWLNLTSVNGYFNQSLFVFSPNGTPNYNNQIDAKRLGSNFGIAIYSLASVTNERLAVDDRGEFQDNITIPLGYYLNNDTVSNLTFSIDHFENLENVNVYLKDKLLNITHDLKISDYVFATSIGIYDNRFEIIFSKNTLRTNEETITNSNNLVISTNDNQINVQVLNNREITNFKIFDVLGKLLVEVNPKASNFTLNTKINNATILFGKATLENGQVLTRKFIK